MAARIEKVPVDRLIVRKSLMAEKNDKVVESYFGAMQSCGDVEKEYPLLAYKAKDGKVFLLHGVNQYLAYKKMGKEEVCVKFDSEPDFFTPSAFGVAEGKAKKRALLRRLIQSKALTYEQALERFGEDLRPRMGAGTKAAATNTAHTVLNSLVVKKNEVISEISKKNDLLKLYQQCFREAMYKFKDVLPEKLVGEMKEICAL